MGSNLFSTDTSLLFDKDCRVQTNSSCLFRKNKSLNILVTLLRAAGISTEHIRISPWLLADRTEPSGQDKSSVILSYNPKLIHSHKYPMSLTGLQALSPPHAVPEALPNGHIVLCHHLVDHDALGLQDGREVGQGEHADRVTHHASAAAMPHLEMVSGQRSPVLLNSPASSDLSDLGYPGQGRDDHLICHEGKLGPLYKEIVMLIDLKRIN